MKKLHFDYDMHIEYSVPVTRCHFTIKCIPADTLRQKVDNIQIRLQPANSYCTGVDGLGNTQIYGVNEDAHTTFDFHIDGDVDTGFAEYEAEASEAEAMIYSHPHGLNAAGCAIRSYYERVAASFDVGQISNGNGPSRDAVKENEIQKPANYDIAMVLMHHLHADFAYQPCTTTIDTPAEEAFVQGHGVCADYAHILIALLHLAEIPARYAAGFVIGEGQSHAWVEVLSDGKWYGLDPTYDHPVTEDYIRLGIGRDAKDCLLNRGIMHGGGLHIQTVHAVVSEQ